MSPIAKRFVVYTVIVGEYDIIEQPLVIDERFDYVLFSDKPEGSKTMGVWQVRHIPFTHKDPTRISRYPKMHPEVLFPQHLASLYIDANLQIIDQQVYDKCCSFYENGVDWGGITLPCPPHPDCIYDHSFWVLVEGLDYDGVVLKWCHKRIFENNVIFRIHNETCHRVNNLWWNSYCNYSRRDQLSLFYSFWRYPEIHFEPFLPKGVRAFDPDNSYFNHSYHKHIASETRTLKHGAMNHVRIRLYNVLLKKRDKWCSFFYSISVLPVCIAKALLFLWGVWGAVVYGPYIKYLTIKKRKRIII